MILSRQPYDNLTLPVAVRAANRNWRAHLVGASQSMQDLARTIELVACRRCTVLISGETGTGKEAAARAIHQASDRFDMPMVAVNCGAIPEHLLESELFGHTKGAFTGAAAARVGLFEQANHSTLFLDEIGDMPLNLQTKLLRVLQERQLQRLGSSETINLNVRVLAASNQNLGERVKQGRFREDLFYRLNVVPITMPPLRDRPEDVPLLARHFLEKTCRLEGLPPKTMGGAACDHLMRYSWPGNVRQLQNLVERAAIISAHREHLLPEDFPLPHMGGRFTPAADGREAFQIPDEGIDFAQVVMAAELAMLNQALQKANGNRTLAADLLCMKRTTLVSKLKALGLEGKCGSEGTGSQAA